MRSVFGTYIVLHVARPNRRYVLAVSEKVYQVISPA